MSVKKKICLAFCGVLICAAVITCYSGNSFFTRPLDPSLELNFKKPPAVAVLHNENQTVRYEPSAQKAIAAEPEISAGKASIAQAPAPPLPDIQDIVQPPPAQEQTMNCGFSGSMIVLFLGTDERMELPYGADAIRFIKVDFTNLTVTVVDLSRDLWVKTPALANRKIKAERLGNIFDIVQTSTKGTLKEQYLAATAVLTQTIFDNFEIAPDRYITVPQSSFSDLVDGLGGIEVEVPEDVDAYKYVVQKGIRTLNGPQALAYIRQVDTFGSGDLKRNSRQLPYIKALLARMGEPANIIKLPGIMSHLQENFVTDLSPARLASLACMLGQVPRANITFHALPHDMIKVGPKDSLVPNYEMINPWLRDLLKK